ncbi:hypothetical protein [Flavobacterium cerinum]|uniref:DUF4303 domain-containing protein n=1 Tax=Flavobacterium cerinum TaxID=2502784 RepID=A0ABY5IRG6_9FLAO|nr:hypothetical protein [Flavobacterium cerinum]UUC44373.1 hypothetical protein NOX80_12090 [Flavobacterium cerinum]
MEINKVHSDLKDIYKAKAVKRKFNFTFEHEDEKGVLMNALKRGFWSIMPFGFKGDDILAFQLTPGKDIQQEAPIVVFDDVYRECFTFAPTIQATIPMANLKFMCELELIQELQEEIEEATVVSQPFFDYFGGGDLEFLKQFLLSESNQERFENAPEYEEVFYKEFWSHYYNTPENTKAFQLFDQLIDSRIRLPEYEPADYGLWNNYIGNVLATRAYSRISLEDKDKWKHYWRCAQLPHGFDCDDNSFEEYTIHVGHSSSLLNCVADIFDSEWKDKYALFPEEVQKHPLFEATEAIREAGRGYAGDRHIKAAVLLEKEHNDPIGCWNALISASYWAGKSGNLDAVEMCWGLAIDLSRTHGWTEIHAILSEQMEFYYHYKE